MADRRVQYNHGRLLEKVIRLVGRLDAEFATLEFRREPLPEPTDGEVYGPPLLDEQLARTAIDDAKRVISRASVSEADLEETLSQLTKVCVWGLRPQILQELGLPYPVYNFLIDPIKNYDDPPLMPRTDVVALSPSAVLHRRTLFGREIAMPFGIAASPFTANERWAACFAERGFDVITYKTVRTQPRRPHPEPTWVFVTEDVLPPANEPVHGWRGTFPRNLRDASMVNSFGVESKGRSKWCDDLKRLRARMAPHQVLIVSVIGDAGDDPSVDELANEFADTAAAAAPFADAIELNFSNPNAPEGPDMAPPRMRWPLYELESAREVVVSVVHAVRAEVPPSTPILAKFGPIGQAELHRLLAPIHRHIAGVVGINAVPRNAFRPPEDRARWLPEGGKETFVGQWRKGKRGTLTIDNNVPRNPAGVSGGAVRREAIDFVRSAVAVRDALSADWEILAMGGVFTPEDARELFDAGATVVQCVTGALFNPGLAQDVLEAQVATENVLFRTLHRAGWLTEAAIVRRSKLPAAETRRSLEYLVHARCFEARERGDETVYHLHPRAFELLNATRRAAAIARFVGRSLSAEAVTVELGRSMEDVAGLRRDGRLWARDEGATTWYPTWQFLAGEIRPDLSAILAHLEPDTTDALIADGIMREPRTELSGMSISDALDDADLRGRALGILDSLGEGF